jgi:hypothetical protein
MKIKTTFLDFLAESTLEQDAQVSALVQELQRNYETMTSFGSSAPTSMKFIEEKKSWYIDPKKIALEDTEESTGNLMVKIQKDADEIEFNLSFVFAYKGVENFDHEQGNMYDEINRLGVSLEMLKISKISVKSQSLNYSETKFSKDLGKTVLRFLLDILRPQFDMIGDESLIIRQL